jgi:hypothetical protein
MMPNATTQILSGHLNEYPLSDILDILHHKRTTGRLFIDYPAAPSVFFFRDGEPVEVQVGVLTGARAVVLAAGLPDSPFNFDPRVEPPLKPVDGDLRKAVLDFIIRPEGEPSRNAAAKGGAPVGESGASGESAADVTLFAKRVLPGGTTHSLPVPASGIPGHANHRKRALIFAGALLTLGAVAPIVAFTGVFGGRPEPAPAAAERSQPDATKGVAPDTHESLFGDTGYSDLTSGGGGRPVGGVERWEKTGQPPRATSQKRAKAEATTRPVPAPAAAPGGGEAEWPGVSRASNSGEPTVTVVTRVENGRVVEAYVANRRPGMEAYEATALRAARQRRFSPGTTGSEQVQVKVVKH